MSGPTTSAVAVPDTTRRGGAARTKEKLLEHWERPVGGRNRAASSPVDFSESWSWRKARA